MEIIKIQNLKFTYSASVKPALCDISLAVNKGEFVTLCGKSGCGKSTLLRCLKPVLTPNGTKVGDVFFEGRELSMLSQKDGVKKIGFVLQNPDDAIVCDKVWHELAFGLESLGCSGDEIRARVAEMASFFGIQSWFHKDTSELSGGQKQLLCLASVMVMQPSVLILDEPTSQLDPIAAHDFLNTVSKINKELGTTVVLSEHRLEEALPLSHRVAVMENGKIIADGNVREVGEILKSSQNPMLCAFPTPMRVYYSKENGKECPVDVREARAWLENQRICQFELPNTQAFVQKDVVLFAKELWFRYDKNGIDVLKGLELQVHKGQLYAIVGGNGAGKTTALSVINGIHKAYRGKIQIAQGKTIATLPQNPKCLFVKDTVREDLWEVLDDVKWDKAKKQEKIQSVVDFCRLWELLDSHPYDLSGGEQQRAALAKVLLTEPDILLLDEPTKALDAHFKDRLAGLLSKLKQSGVAIVMVSHDVEFCAKYADRVGMFFDGAIVSEGSAREFFSGKSFYTTSANRMARGIIDGAVLDTDIISAICGKPYTVQQDYDENTAHSDSDNDSVCENKNKDKCQMQEKPKTKLSKSTVLQCLIVVLLIPLTVFLGDVYLGERKYLITSLLIIVEAMLPFFLMFEGRRPAARELVLISVLCAIAVVGRIAFAAIPQFKPVTALVIIFGVCFGGQTGFLVGAITGFVSNFYFSQGPWTPWQMFAWGTIGLVSGVLFSKGMLSKKRLPLCVFGFLATLVVFGGIMNVADVLISQGTPTFAVFVSRFASGFPMDMIHAVSTVIFLWIGARPLCKKLDRVKLKYGMS